MKLNELKPAEGSTKKRKVLGRGQGTGRGGTSTRGHKGAKSRSGYSRKRNFEGGQMPLQMRLPKRGFNNINRVEYAVLNLDTLQAISEKYNTTNIDSESLTKHGIVNKRDKIKILGRGELKAALTIKVHACSEAAKKAVEAAGGSIEIVK